MKTFATNEKHSAPAVRKACPYVHHPMGPVQQAQQAEVRHILRSTGAQARLTIGQPNDEYEQEADRVADQVMRMPDPKLQRQLENEEEEEMLQPKPLADQITPLIQRQAEPEEEEEELVQPGYDQEPEEPTPFLESVPTRDAGELGGEEEELVQAKSDMSVAPQVISGVARDIQSIKGTGQPLPGSERAFFEPRFGTDFSNVRVHTDNRAVRTAQSINARAFTLGRDVVFGAGQYSPGTSSSRKLLAHELTHVLQQSGRAKPQPAVGLSRKSGLSYSRCNRPLIQMRRGRRYRRPRPWTRVKGKTNIWRATRTMQSLQGLSYILTRSRRNWMCIRPTKMKYPVTPYWQHVSLGDEFDVSNLTKRTGPALALHELTNLAQALWAQNFYGAVRSSQNPYSEIVGKASGNQPINNLLLIAHTNSTQMGRFILTGLSADRPAPTYARALKGDFPNRCLFTRNARIRTVGCSSLNFGRRFARVFLRRGALVRTTTRPVCMAVDRNRWFIVRNRTTGQVVSRTALPDRYMVCFSRNWGNQCHLPNIRLTGLYNTRRAFHGASYWRTIYGLL